MGLAAPRFTIRSLMIAVAVIAGVLGLYQLMSENFLAVLIVLLYVSLIGVWWWMFRGLRRLSALCVGITAAVASIASFLLGICLNQCED